MQWCIQETANNPSRFCYFVTCTSAASRWFWRKNQNKTLSPSLITDASVSLDFLCTFVCLFSRRFVWICRPHNFKRNQCKCRFSCSNLSVLIWNWRHRLDCASDLCSQFAIVHCVSPFLLLSSSFSFLFFCQLFLFGIDATLEIGILLLNFVQDLISKTTKKIYTTKKFGHTLTSPSELRWCFFSCLTFSVGAAVVNDVFSINHYVQLNKITPPSRQSPNDLQFILFSLALSLSVFMCVSVCLCGV